MKYWYRLAGMTIAVDIPEEQHYEGEGVLPAYAVEDISEDPAENRVEHLAQDPAEARAERLLADYTMTMRMADSLPSPEGECVYCDSAMQVYQQGAVQIRYKGPTTNGTADAYMWIRREGCHSQILLRQKYYQSVSSKAILDAMEAEHRVVERGGFLFHASCIEVDGKALLFTAPSGTGKSTQADLWERHRGAEIINGDRIAVLCELLQGCGALHERGADTDGNCADGAIAKSNPGIIVAGIPYSGSSGISKNVTLPLRAIVYLSQAPQTTIRPLRGREAFCRIWEGICVNSWDRQDVDRCIGLVQRVIDQVPIYHLACTPDESAIRALEGVLLPTNMRKPI